MTPFQKQVSIPFEGEHPESILRQIREMKQEDVDWKQGRAWSLVYYANEEHDALLKAAHSELFSTNYLNPLAFRSLHRMEQEVVHMCAHLLNGDEHSVGVMTSGGTESILLAMFCYRQRARKLTPRITRPEVVAPVTIHPAFDKAAELFGLTLRKAAADENRKAVAGRMESLVNANTILVVASAPSYPNGVLDPVTEIAAMASRHNIPVHVDACIGGFMLPWLEKLGYSLPLWDFRIPGVTSVSADAHKFGYGAKGASVLVYRNMDYMQHQFVVTTDFPGGIYISPTLLGTRPGGPIAAAWAGMHHLGEKGYLQLAGMLMEATLKLRNGLQGISGITIVGDPCMNILSFTTTGERPDIFVIADQLEARGWMVDRQHLPNCIHLTVLPTNCDKVDQYLQDLQLAYQYAEAHPGDAAKGNAAVYGLMARIPFRGVVEKNVKKIMTDMYGGGGDTISGSPAWMGWFNRLLAFWGRRKSKRKGSLHSWLLLFTATFFSLALVAQPFVDPFQVRYTHAFRKDGSQATPFSHLWMGSDLPIKLREKTYLLLSPFYEQWKIDSAGRENSYPSVKSLALPIGLIFPLGDSRWSVTVIPTFRWNGEELFGGSTFQFGGATFASLERKPNKKLRFGVYMNGEFSGLFVWPLLGADWKIDDRNYVFGLLPGRLTYEHKWSEKLFWGATFRALTNSYRLPNGQFLRLEDNQVSVHLDYYPAKRLCIMLEPGYGLIRKARTGINDNNYITDTKMGDGLFIRLSGSYRVRL